MKDTICSLVIAFAGILQSYGQKSLTIDLSTSCNVSDITSIGAKTYYLFAPSAEAKTIIKSILDAVGLQSNFELNASDVDNATAFLDDDGNRYILYNEFFINDLKNTAQTKWAGYFVLAHEIGHHLNGHTLSIGGERKQLELEADEFAGFVLYKLGVTLEEVKAALNMADQNGSETHPPRSARLAAAARGWIKARDEKGVGKKLECDLKNTGNYCVYNNTIKTYKISLFSSPIKELTIAPGDSQCFYSIPTGNYNYEITEVDERGYLPTNGYANEAFEKGELLFEKCLTKPLNIGFRKIYQPNKGDLCIENIFASRTKIEIRIKKIGTNTLKSAVLAADNSTCFNDIEAGNYIVGIYVIGMYSEDRNLWEEFEIQVIAGRKVGKAVGRI